jgi:VIT1/CCC1 family predicted Fe2+/Mn2+ transporter
MESTPTSPPAQAATPADIKRYRENYQGEIDGVELYHLLARAEKDPDRAQIFLDLAETEKGHVQVWAKRLRDAGVDLGDPRPTMRVRMLGFLARWLGTRAVLPMVSAMESTGFDNYMAQAEAGPTMARDERSHSRALATLSGQTAGEPAAAITRDERWHRVDAGGTFRAAIFGVNDGLVSNLSLVIGVAGADPEGRFIILAGVAGLLAGAFSMGAGEFVSVMSQRELFERQLALEKEELEADPESERRELALIYRAKGLSRDEAELVWLRLAELRPFCRLQRARPVRGWCRGLAVHRPQCALQRRAPARHRWHRGGCDVHDRQADRRERGLVNSRQCSPDLIS